MEIIERLINMLLLVVVLGYDQKNLFNQSPHAIPHHTYIVLASIIVNSNNSDVSYSNNLQAASIIFTVWQIYSRMRQPSQDFQQKRDESINVDWILRNETIEAKGEQLHLTAFIIAFLPLRRIKGSDRIISYGLELLLH